MIQLVKIIVVVMEKISVLVASVFLFSFLALLGNPVFPDSNELNKQLETKNDSSNSLFNASYKEYKSERYIRNSFEENEEWVREADKEIEWGGNLYDVNRYTEEKQRDVYLENAWTLYNRTYENAEEQGWFDLEKAREDGFNNTYSIDHYVNADYYRDNQSLNPRKPDFLMFRENSSGSSVLIGVMYMLNDVEAEGRQVGGPITQWHYHTFRNARCYYNGYSVSVTDNCPDSYYSKKSPEMLHVWFVDHPKGVFATDMAVPLEEVDSGNEKMNRSAFFNLF